MSARGASAAGSGSGAGGSVLLRALGGVKVTGTIDATGGSAGYDGRVRIDCWKIRPVITGWVKPRPLVLALPELRNSTPPGEKAKIVFSSVGIPGAWLALYISARPANINVPGLGIWKLDPLLGFHVTSLPYATIGDDPILRFALPIPNPGQLKGLRVHFQGLAVNLGKNAWLGHRYTNDVVLRIGM